MAHKTITVLIDDLDNSEVESGGQTVRFGFGGVHYEIDLSPRNAEKLHTALAPYIAAGRRITGGRHGAPKVPAEPVSVDRKAVRAWAASHNIDIPPRGRISADIIEQYRAAGH